LINLYLIFHPFEHVQHCFEGQLCLVEDCVWRYYMGCMLK
jgi:hypothetical protein